MCEHVCVCVRVHQYLRDLLHTLHSTSLTSLHLVFPGTTSLLCPQIISVLTFAVVNGDQ